MSGNQQKDEWELIMGQINTSSININGVGTNQSITTVVLRKGIWFMNKYDVDFVL